MLMLFLQHLPNGEAQKISNHILKNNTLIDLQQILDLKVHHISNGINKNIIQ